MIRLRALGAVELLRDDGTEVGSVTAQPKRLALLVYLASARPHGFHRRDRLCGLFWPESSESRARGALGQALYFLRRSLGNDVVVGRGDDEVAVTADRLWCDAAAVRDQLDAGNVEGALELYRGDMLPGLFLADAPPFEEWLERERAHLQRRVLEAVSARAAQLEVSAPDSAAALLRRLIEIAPEDERALGRLMQLLDGQGDRAGALTVFETFARRLAAELDIEPAPETLALRNAIVARAAPSGSAQPTTAAVAAPPSVPPVDASGPSPITLAPPPWPGGGPLKRVISVALVMLVTLVTWAFWPRSAEHSTGDAAGFTLAVAPFTTATADTALGRIARELVIPLSANLDGLGDVHAVEGVEVLTTAGAGGAADAAIALGRRLGATRVLYGALVATELGVRAEATLRRVEDRETILRATVHAERDVSALADSLTWALLSELWKDRAPAAESAGVSPPEPGPPALATRSLPALRAYWEGERAASQDRWGDAAEEFARAIALDSTYWFAYWRYAYVRYTVEAPVDEAIRSAYESHRFGFPERDRLLIEARMADSLSERMARYRDLTRRFPEYWPGWWDYANRLVHDGPLLGATHQQARDALERTLTLRPHDVIVLQHLFWMAAQDVDVPEMERVVSRIQELRAASRDFQPSRPDYLMFFEMILAAARADEATLAATIDRNIADLLENVRGPAGDHFAMGLASYGFHHAEIEFSRRLLETAASPELKGAQWRARALTWAARGAWDSALVAAHQYAAAAEGAAPLQHMLRMTAAGEWLGALPAGAADPWREGMARHEAQLGESQRAELAWLDGVLGAARGRRDMLGAARQQLRVLVRERSVPNADAERSQAVARMLDASLQAFEVALGGDPLGAAERLSELERQRAEHGPTRNLAWLHPYLTGINRLAAARLLRENGRPADAETLLTWVDAIEFPGYLVSEATALLSAIAFYERALAAEALDRTELAQQHHAQFLRRYDLAMPAQQPLVIRARRAVRETEAILPPRQ